MRAHLTVGSWLLLWVVRPSWLWRREVAAALLLAAFGMLGWWRHGWAGALVLPDAVVTLAVWLPWSRRWLIASWRRARLRRHWDRACRFANLTTVNDRIPRIRRDRQVPAGDRLMVRVPRGATVGDLEDGAERIAATLRVREVRVARDGERADLAHVDIVRRDPFVNPVAPAVSEPIAWPWLHAARVSLRDPIPVAVDEMGDVVYLRLEGKNILIGGEPEAGKSVALSLLLAAAALDPTARVWGWDAKRVELALWRPLLERIVYGDMGAAIGQMEDLNAEMDDRYEYMEERGKRLFGPEDGPVILAAVDEMRFYTASPDRKESKRFNALGIDQTARGRAARIVGALATQKPSGDVVPTAWRDLVGYRWAMRCTTRDASDTILGAGMAAAGYDASLIDVRARGVGLLYAEGELPRRVKSFYLADDDIRAIVARGVELRRTGSARA